MKSEHIGLVRKDFKKMSYSKLREIEEERILLEIGDMPLAEKITATKNIKKIMREMSWF